MDLGGGVLEKLRKAGKASAQARDFGAGFLREGMTLVEAVERIEHVMRSGGCPPAFPVCISLNDVAAHFTPTHKDETVLRRGDVVKIDLGAHVDGYLADTAKTVEIGTRNWTEMIRAAEEALEAAIEVIRPKVPVRLVGAAIERTIESYGYHPIANLTGHTVERNVVHAGKSIPNVGDAGDDVLEVNDVVAIEPFATNGAGKVDGRKPGNIYRIVRVRDVRPESSAEFLEAAQKAFGPRPFAERWACRLDRKAPSHLARLHRSGLLHAYPFLHDVGQGIVAQAEHTVIVTPGGAERIT